MKYKLSKSIILVALLLFTISLTVQVQAAPAFPSQSAELTVSSSLLNLSEQQKDEIERIVDDRLERSAAVSDRIQNTVNGNFSLLFTLAGLMVTVLSAIPIFSGVAIFLFRKTILHGIEQAISKEVLNAEMKNILEEEVKKQLSNQVEQELRQKIRQKLTELEKTANTDLSEFQDKLNQLFVDIDQEKLDYVKRLKSMDPSIFGEVVTQVVADKFIEFRNIRSPFAMLPGRRRRE